MRHALWFNHSYDTPLPVCHFCLQPINAARWVDEECPAIKCTPPASHIWANAFVNRCVCGEFAADDIKAVR